MLPCPIVQWRPRDSALGNHRRPAQLNGCPSGYYQPLPAARSAFFRMRLCPYAIAPSGPRRRVRVCEPAARWRSMSGFAEAEGCSLRRTTRRPRLLHVPRRRHCLLCPRQLWIYSTALVQVAKITRHVVMHTGCGGVHFDRGRRSVARFGRPSQLRVREPACENTAKCSNK